MTEDRSPWSWVGPQVLFGMDRHGTCTLSAGPGLAALGYADGELVGTSLLDLFRDDPAVLTSVHRALAGDTFTVTREIDGRTLCVSYQALHDASGLFTGSMAVCTDVTEQLVDARRLAQAGRRADTLLALSGALGAAELSPEEVLDTGVRIITEALAEAGVGWLLVDREDGAQEAGGLVCAAVWHADDDLRRRLRDGMPEEMPEEDDGSGWRDATRVRTLRSPVAFVRTEAGHPTGRSPASRLVDDLGLRYGLRMPLRSRGRTIGAADFVRGDALGPFDEQDIAFAQEVADRFALAHDNALLLAEQRSVLRTLLKFRSLADASVDLIAIADQQGRPTYYNPRLRAVGLALPDDDVWASLATYFGEERTVQMRAVMAAGERWSGDVALPTDGTVPAPGEGTTGELLVHAEAFPLVAPDTREPTGFAWIAQDVTRLRATERRLRQANAELGRFQALVEASRDFIAIAGLDGKVSYLNPGGRALVGLEPDDDLTSTTIADYLTAEGLEQSLAVEQPAVREHGSWQGESTLRHFRGGPPIPVAIASFLMHDPDTGAPFGLATVQRDMTERLATERSVRHLLEHRQALLERLVEAQETERAKIAGDVHDDPVQALAVVDLRLGLLRRRITEQAPQLLDAVGAVQETVVAATQRLRALLFDLEAPDLDHGLAPALERAAEELFRDTGTRVEVAAGSEPPADRSLRTVAFRIAREALVNARKHAGAGHVWVTVRDSDGGLAVHVADDGVGLGRGPMRSAPGHHGVTGMRDRASLAGGEVVLADRPGGGALVSLWLPRAPGQG
jgi:PAS domain S-box-containing protein